MKKCNGDFGFIPFPTDKMDREQAQYQLQKFQVILSTISLSVIIYTFLIKGRK